MGAYSPVPIVGADVVDEVMERAVRPTLALAAPTHDIEYRGVLYAGLMLTADGPKVIEYNVRFGDPECPGRAAAARVRPRRAAARPRPRASRSAVDVLADACVTVVLASEGYPASPRTGDAIDGLRTSPSASTAVTVFHAGTARDADGALRHRRRARARRHRDRRRPRRPHGRAPTTRRRGSAGRACSTAATSPRPPPWRNGSAPQASANPAPGPYPGDDERAGDAPQRAAVFRRRDEAHRAPVLAAGLAFRDGVLGPVLRAVHHPRSTSSPDWDRPDRFRNRPDRGRFRAVSGS